MSEPMSAVEIEDVLSSIRRLVSEDLRPTHRLVSAALEQGPSKLILTPALRIVSDGRGALPEPADGSDEPHDLRLVLQNADPDEANETAETAEIFPVFGSVRQQDQLERQSRDLKAAGDGQLPDANFLATAMSRINGLASANDNTDLVGQSDRIETALAAVGAAVGPEEWEPDGGEPAPQARAWADAVWNSADAADDVVQPDQDATLDLTEAADLDPADAVEAEVEAEAGDVFDAATSDMWSGDARAHDVQADTVVAPAASESDWDLSGQDTIVFQDIAVLRNDSRDYDGALAPADGMDFDDTAGFLNEDVLREIVRDMIREEFQGNLGERITRNVRKLVRAEINRALLSRDFE
jgi:hypothetical protein